MAIDPFTALKPARSSSEDENSDNGKLQSKKKENSPTDVPVVVSGGDYDTGPEEYGYMITADTWKDLSKALRMMVKGLIAEDNYMQAMAYRRTGMTITVTEPKDFETE
jgi:hypothetical protein